ncbi:hypothetical protein BH23PLA1_BH23PLA1_02320 [soil metagenome]
MAELSPDLMTPWEQDGYLILPGFYRPEEIAQAEACIPRAWKELGDRVVVDDLMTGRRQLMGSVSAADRRDHNFKLNDLFLEFDEIRHLALNDRLTPILRAALSQAPVLCNSLSFERGSQQPDHVDALYMTPRSTGHLIAIWVALEDCHLDAGPLNYYPGSHKIPPYVFSNGSNHHVPAEMPLWRQYMDEQVRQRGLVARQFAARKGDVFIWHAYLFHGGAPINDPARTRKSIVFHYFSEQDCQALGCDLVPFGQSYWMRRSPQPVPEERPQAA